MRRRRRRKCCCSAIGKPNAEVKSAIVVLYSFAGSGTCALRPGFLGCDEPVHAASDPKGQAMESRSLPSNTQTP